jgi:hypothetical protein
MLMRTLTSAEPLARISVVPIPVPRRRRSRRPRVHRAARSRQINARVPADLSPGFASVAIRIGGAASQGACPWRCVNLVVRRIALRITRLTYAGRELRGVFSREAFTDRVGSVRGRTDCHPNTFSAARGCFSVSLRPSCVEGHPQKRVSYRWAGRWI